MPDYPRQYEDGGFRKTFVVVGAVHLVLLGGLLLMALYQPKQSNDTVVWMSPGSFANDSAAGQGLLTGDREPTAPPDQELNQPSPQETDQEEESPSPPSATPPPHPASSPVVESPLPIATPTPAATPMSRLTPTPTPAPRSAATAKPSPKPSPRPTAKLTPKPSPTHSAAPKSSPKTEVAPREKEKEKPKIDDSPKPKTSPTKAKEREKANTATGSSARQTETGRSQGRSPHDQMTPGRSSLAGSGSGAGGNKVGGSEDSALAAYVGILSSRFQAAWNQPTSEMALGKTLAVTVNLKVDADGTVTEFVIAEGSGNAVVDESVREAGKKITKLPPPPNGQAFSAPVRFELGN
jgi:TonB family protein